MNTKQIHLASELSQLIVAIQSGDAFFMLGELETISEAADNWYSSAGKQYCAALQLSPCLDIALLNRLDPKFVKPLSSDTSSPEAVIETVPLLSDDERHHCEAVEE